MYHDDSRDKEHSWSRFDGFEKGGAFSNRMSSVSRPRLGALALGTLTHEGGIMAETSSGPRLPQPFASHRAPRMAIYSDSLNAEPKENSI